MSGLAFKSMSAEQHDVAIIDAGIAGGRAGTVLARNGVRTLMLNAGTHPRFAVGESTIPYTSAMIKVIAERYQVPEIEPLASFRGTIENNFFETTPELLARLGEWGDDPGPARMKPLFA